MILNIITPCSRPKNLPVVARSIRENLKAFDVRWHCWFDQSKVTPETVKQWEPFFASTGMAETDGNGNPQRNRALDACSGDWVYFLDDDNVVHPGFEDRLARATEVHPSAPGFIFAQLNEAGGHLRSPYPTWHEGSGNLDMAQFVLKREFIGSTRFRMIRESDWHLLNDCCMGNPGQLVLVDERVTFYNALHSRRMTLIHEPRVPGNGGLPNDETINRVAGLFELLDSLSSEDRRRVVEIGSYRGISTEAFAMTCDSVIAVDSFLWPEVYNEFYARTHYYPHVQAIRGYSTAVAENFPDEYFDLVYVDAGHSHEEVVADIRAWRSKVRLGGVIAGHDFHHTLPGVISAVRQELGEPERVFSDFSWLVRKR